MNVVSLFWVPAVCRVLCIRLPITSFCDLSKMGEWVQAMIRQFLQEFFIHMGEGKYLIDMEHS